MLRRDGAGAPDADDLLAPVSGEEAIGVAVSGGVDSLALMVLVADWQQRHQRQVHVYTVDHGLRPEAASECAMVAGAAEKLGLQAHVLCWQGAKPTTGLQAAARRARYRLIGAKMREHGVRILLTAHHAGDQAETVLMRMAHGSGLDGLGGMRAMAMVENVHLFRPLLALGKSELELVVARAGLEPAKDPSNDNEVFERVRWRSLMPQLAEHGLDAHRLGRIAARAARASSALEQIARETAGRIVRIRPTGLAVIDRGEWLDLSEEIGLRVLASTVRWAGAGLHPYGLQQLEALTANLRAGTDLRAHTVAGAVVASTADGLRVWREAGRIDPAPRRIAPQSDLIWDSRFRVENRADHEVVVRPAWDLTREAAERIAGQKLREPMSALRAAPVVQGENGEVFAFGELCLDAAVCVAHANWANGTQVFSGL